MLAFSDFVDSDNMKKAEFKIEDSNKVKLKGNLLLGDDGNFTSSVSLTDLNLGLAKVELKLEDNNKKKFKVKESILILEPPPVPEQLSLIHKFILTDLAGYPPDILKINDNGLFAISYLSTDRLTSIIQTISIDDDGMNYHELDQITFPSGGLGFAIEQLGNDRYLLWGNGMFTVQISDDGSFGELSERFSITSGFGGVSPRPILTLDESTFLIAHQFRETSTAFPGIIEVLGIHDDGNLFKISELMFELESGLEPSPVMIDADTMALAFRNDHVMTVSTFDIANLDDIQEIQRKSFGTAFVNEHAFIPIENNVFALLRGGIGEQIQTISIDNNGIIGDVVESVSLSSNVKTPTIINFNEDLYVSAFKNGFDYLLDLESITDDSITVQDQIQFASSNSNYINPVFSMSTLNERTLVVIYADIESQVLNLFTFDIS